MLRNLEDFLIPQMSVQVSIFDGVETGGRNNQYLAVAGPAFAMKPKEERIERFSIMPPAGLAGEFFIVTEALNDRKQSLGGAMIPVHIEGSNEFVIITNMSLMADGRPISLFSGDPIQPGAPMVVTIEVQNDGDARTVRPFAIVDELNAGVATTATAEGDTVTLAPHATTTVTLQLPHLAKPTTYAARIAFKDANGRLVSNEADFRIVIAGRGATIWRVMADKDSYRAGDTAVVVLTVTGPADFSQVGDVDIRVALMDGNAVAGSATVHVSLDQPQTLTVNIPVTRDVAVPRVDVSVLKDGSELASYHVPLGKAPQAAPSLATYWLIFVVIVIIIAIGFLVWRSRRGTVVLLALITFLALIASAQAVIVVSNFGITYSWWAPAYGSASVGPQDWVHVIIVRTCPQLISSCAHLETITTHYPMAVRFYGAFRTTTCVNQCSWIMTYAYIANTADQQVKDCGQVPFVWGSAGGLSSYYADWEGYCDVQDLKPGWYHAYLFTTAKGNSGCIVKAYENICIPESDKAVCALGKASCGTVTMTDSCGAPRTVDCGACETPNTCGGGGSPGVCGCTSLSQETACSGKNCGTVSNGCGTVSCGTCTSPGFCHNNNCCTPVTDGELCAEKEYCGTVTLTDNCDQTKTVNCGVCASPDDVCYKNACCTPETDPALCAAYNSECSIGTITLVDRCGQTRTVNCGDCPPTAYCVTQGSPPIGKCVPYINCSDTDNGDIYQNGTTTVTSNMGANTPIPSYFNLPQ
jgi:hypothetical protein